MAKLKTSTITGDLSVSGNINGKTNASELNRGTVPRERLNVGTTSVTGIVQLNDSVSSNSTTQAATANAVKKANDNANGKLSKSGGTVTGDLTIGTGGNFIVNRYIVLNAYNNTDYGTGEIKLWANKTGTGILNVIGAKDISLDGNFVYHAGRKPTSADIGASPSNHNHDGAYLGKNANAVSSSKLAAPRTINGTNFDGTANITTANWGNSRTITLGGDLTGSVAINGGANVTLNAEVKNDSHNHSNVKGLHGGSIVVNDHGNGNVTVAAAKSSSGAIGDLYLGYNSGSHFTKDVLLGKTMKWQSNGNIIVNSEGKIPWGSLTGLPSSFTPSAHTHDDRYLRLAGGTMSGEIQMNDKPIRLTAIGSKYARIGYDSDSGDTYISNNNNNWFRLKANGTLTVAGNKVYSAGDKPTPGEIGAVKQSVLGANVNLNSLTAPGEYEQNANANTSIALNYPEALAGHLTVTTGAGTQQRYHVYNTTRVYTRAVYNGGSWTEWAQQYNSNNRPSPAQLGAAAISGGAKIFCQTSQPSATATGDIWISW